MKLRQIVEQRSLSYADIWAQGLDVPHSMSTATGKHVTATSAMTVAPLFGCVRIISGIVGTLPIDFFNRDDDEVKRRYRPKPEWLNFNFGPLNRISIVQTAMVSMLLEGNAYFATYRDPFGDIIGLKVLDPTKVEPKEDSLGGVRYEIQQAVGGIESLGPMDILHIPGMMFPGHIKGMSPIRCARETLGLSMGLEEFGGTFFKNDARPGLAVEVPGELSEVGAQLLKASWNETHQGSGNAHRLALLTEGAKLKQVTVNPDDAQYLETKKIQTPQIAMFYGVPPYKLGYADSPQFGTSIAEQNTAFITDTIREWVERIETGFSDAQRLSGSTPPDAFVGLSLNDLVRGDRDSRIATNVMAVREGIMTINEARTMEDFPPVEWGDEPISVQVQDTDIRDELTAP